MGENNMDKEEMAKYKSEYNTKWKKDNTRRYEFYLRKDTEQDVIDFLGTIKNRQDYIKNLIINDMSKK